ncbi:MAG: hypothetical protein AB7G37_17440 [Solirubrobacteraceae bacterium]
MTVGGARLRTATVGGVRRRGRRTVEAVLVAVCVAMLVAVVGSVLPVTSSTAATATARASDPAADGPVAVAPPAEAIVAAADALERISAIVGALGDPDDPVRGIAATARAVAVAAGGDPRSPLDAAARVLRRTDRALTTIGPRTRTALDELLGGMPGPTARAGADLAPVTAMLGDLRGIARDARGGLVELRRDAPAILDTLGALRGGARRAVRLDEQVRDGLRAGSRLLDASTVRGIADRQARSLRRARPGLRSLAALERRCGGVSGLVAALAGGLEAGERFGTRQRVTIVVGRAPSAVATESDGCPR